MAIEELIAQFLIIAVGALAGSAFMWLVLGPIVIRRAAPKLVRGVMRDIAGLTDGEIEAEKGDFFKAMTRKQGETFANAIYGAMGKIVQTAPDSQLEKLAKQYGFESVEDAAAKLGGQGGGAALGPGLGDALAKLGGAKSGGFSRIVELITALSAFQQLGGDGALSGLSGMAQTGGTHGRTW